MSLELFDTDPNIKTRAYDELTGERIEPDRVELQQRGQYEFAMDRRSFLATLGAGLTITLAGPRISFGASPMANVPVDALEDRLHIGPDGIVTALSGKVECGQGARTELAMAAAEELRVPLVRVHMLMADTTECPNDGATAGSRTTGANVPDMRRAAALARETLIDLAAKKWNIARDQVEARDGAIFKKGGAERLSFGELVGDAGFKGVSLAGVASVALTPIDDWKILGAPQHKLLAREVVTGTNQYPSDIRREGMLYGKVLRAPAYNSRLVSVDTSVAAAMPGVVVAHEADFVAVAAPNSSQARKAIEAIAPTAKWESGAHPSSAELFDYLKANEQAGTGAGRGGRGGSGRGVGAESAQGGAAGFQAAFDACDKKLEAVYTTAYIQHAPMETRASVAEWNADGSVTVWTGTQMPSRVQSELAQAFSIAANKARVIVPDVGGGFGGKHTGECAVEAARIAKAAGKPVSLHWSREEEFTWAYFRPAARIEVRAGLNDRGHIAAWEFVNINSGQAALNTPYEVDGKNEAFHRSAPPLKEGSYRALASTANTFARETAMNELAALQEWDPIAFREAHLPSGRLRDVVQAAHQAFGWEGRAGGTGDGRGVGFACGTEKGSYVACCVEVELDATARDGFRITDIVESYECGAILNPANLKAQVEGAIVQGLGGAIFEAMKFAGGKMQNAHFADYRVPRFRDTPPIQLVLLDRKDLPSIGAGETPIIALAPALAAAIFSAGGQRLRSLPLNG